MNEIGRKIVDKMIEIHGSAEFSIAFLPYKRSMWNSMQSVYEECIASGIDAHCYPIPYLRMKENKQPDYIDTDFELFGDIAERIEELEHTDYIAIHYQYEDHNKVTNMLPQYFTKALKDRYKCKIIYLPYGIGSGRAGFALQPGCKYIDYGFLEDSDNAERFIAGWLTQGIDFTGRVFALGSAKLDLATREACRIPDEWSQIIDGRSVTLVANSLRVYLIDPIGRMVKYRQIIHEEVDKGRAVIFRPHPLLRTTIKSMQPNVSEYYEGFIKTIKKMDHVIVDETEILEYAFGCADRLVSDPSSLVPMWVASGRPMREIP